MEPREPSFDAAPDGAAPDGKGERTRLEILRRTAPLFNERGYFGTSMRDVMRVTGLQKGGIYRHFGSKDELALAAFDFAHARLRERFGRAIRSNRSTVDRLRAVVDEVGALLDDPYLAGGCPIFNTAVEGSDAHPDLTAKAREAMEEWRTMIVITVRKGRERGEMKGVDEESVATVIIAAIEGAIVMAKLYDDRAHIRRVVAHLQDYIGAAVAA